MKLLVVCDSIYEFDTSTKQFTPHKLNVVFPAPFRYVSMCRDNDGFIFYTQDRLVFTDSQFNVTKEIKTDFSTPATHAVAIHGDNVYMTDTLRDRIAIYNRTSSQWRYLIVASTNADTRHLNTVRFIDDTMYAVCHNWGDSDILGFYDDTLITTQEKCGWKAHEVWKYDSKIWYCNSHYGRVETNEDQITLDADHSLFLRGAELVNDTVWIGSSVNRFRDHLPSKTGIFEVNLATKQVISCTPLPNGETRVCSIIAV